MAFRVPLRAVAWSMAAVFTMGFLALISPLACRNPVVDADLMRQALSEELLFTRFSSPKAEYVFDAPVGWQVKDRLSEPEPGAGFIGPYNEARSFAVVLMIRRYEKAPAGSSLDAILRELHETADKEAVRELATRAVEIDGYPSRVVRLKRVWRLLLLMVEAPEFPVVERHLIIERGGYLYRLTYVAPEELDARYAMVFEQAMGTFHFRPSFKEGSHP